MPRLVRCYLTRRVRCYFTPPQLINGKTKRNRRPSSRSTTPPVPIRFISNTHFLRQIPGTRPSPLSPPSTTHANSVQAFICSAYNPLTSEILNCLPSLELVITTSTDVDHTDLCCCRSRGIVIANADKPYTEDVAYVAVGLLLSVLRKVLAFSRRLSSWFQGYCLQVGGKLVGIVGLGSIGAEVAKRQTAFDCFMSYNIRGKKDKVSLPYYINARDLAVNSDPASPK